MLLLLLIIILIGLSLFSFFYTKHLRNTEHFYNNSRNPKSISRYSQKYYSSNIEKPISNYNFQEIQMVESNPKLLSQILD
jgi:hypothetical protein